MILISCLIGLSVGLFIYLIILRDRFKKTEDEKNGILESLEEGVVTLDEELFVKSFNEKALQLLGVLKEDFSHSRFLQIDDSKYPLLLSRCQDLIKQSNASTQVERDSFEIGNHNKTYRELIVTPLPNKKGFILVLQDSFHHHKMQEIGKDFVANASHELRTPITIIKGFAETLRDLPVISGAMLQDITEKIVRNCHRMSSLVTNLLTLADLDYLPKARMQECDLVGLIENCSYSLLSVYPKVSIETLHNNESITVLADPDLMERAVMNLLENAVKYSPSDAKITVTIEEKEEKVSLVIRDHGIGIPEEAIEHIFDRFYTVNKAHSRRLGGAGLGLSIVKTIVKKHNGAIEVASDKGTSFTITLKTAKYALSA